MACDKHRVLVVEDDAMAADALKRTLEKLGYIVAAVLSSGSEVLSWARLQHQYPIDAAIMDIILEGSLDGIETAARLRALVDCPIIYLTGYADKYTLERAQYTEPYGYLMKPFGGEELHASLHMAISKFKAERARMQQLTRMPVKRNQRKHVGHPISIVDATMAFALNRGLTPTESRVLELMAGGQSRASIAHRQGSSINTIKMHLQRIYRKLGVKGHRDLIHILTSRL